MTSTAVKVRRRNPRRHGRTGIGTVTGKALFLRYVLLTLVGVLLLGPLLLPLLAAFKAPTEAVFGQGASLIPREWSLDAFVELFTRTQIVRFIVNSLVVCVLTVGSALVLSSLGGYMLSRRGWKGRNLALILVLSTLIFPFESIMLSLYAQVRSIGLYDTLAGIWLPMMLGPFHLLLMRAAFLGIPDEIEDAAFLDGAGEWQRFWLIFLPQVKGALTVVGLTAFISAWQDYLWPLLITQSESNTTMMLGIAQLQSSFGTDYRVVLAGAITALVPIAIVFFLSQKYFFRGVEEGGLKF
jgi:ABC-type glycerol-3-phosphate transport system permease component